MEKLIEEEGVSNTQLQPKQIPVCISKDYGQEEDYHTMITCECVCVSLGRYLGKPAVR